MNFKCGAVANEQRRVLIGSVLESSLHKQFVHDSRQGILQRRETNNFIHPDSYVNVFLVEWVHFLSLQHL